ncbi:hypothetical protein MtrunA17_Chr8g0346491 [Medicago truncatula]|uniref:Uncharacterized protein n=1 Tax=Medicago truncatula TaxID=3880 RepID=A0A396GJA9_MEDTR|nr:hypothetical protein MtrunA17_Chr8g0346491 [Medicago truncatula]
MQNSVSFSFPSPSRSPCLTIASASSLLIPSMPSMAEFFLRLSLVIKPVSWSARRLKPPHSSDTKVSTSSFSAIIGSKSSNSASMVVGVLVNMERKVDEESDFWKSCILYSNEK